MQMKRYFLLTMVLLLLTGCGKNSRPSKAMAIADSLGIQESVLLSLEDDHGGFHGDGDTVLLLETPGFQPGAAWKEFPLPETLSIALWGGMTAETQWGSLLTDDQGNPLMPMLEEGYYFFQDRHSDSADSEDPSGLLSRGSFNFTLAVYDPDSERVYYFEKDT